VRRAVIKTASLGLILAVTAALGQQRNFVACPIVRDTKTVPCFLAEYNGALYYLGMQQDLASEFHPPQLKHEVLVEGNIAEGPRVCGGIPLQPVSVSVLKEVNLACNTVLPPEPGMDAPTRSEAGSVPPGEPLTGRHEFTILYAFNDDYLEYAGNLAVTEAAAYAKRIGAASVRISGYTATTLLSNGDRIVEKAGIAEKRAQEIAMLLRGLGVSGLTVEWKTEPDARRRVTIVVTP
jgi:hypothetical protein